MSKPRNPIVLIPSRMASSRLPNKPLADIHGEPMIVHVWRRSVEADVGRVVVAAGEPEIVDAVISAGGEAVLTDPSHPSGSDRIHEALLLVDADGAHDAILNVQGDLPVLEPHVVRATMDLLDNSAVDIGTAAAEITDEADRHNTAVNKAVVAWCPDGLVGRALYFTKAQAPTGGASLFHHIGLYAYRRAALERFVSLPPSPLEKSEKLEQLRALEDGMRIEVARVDTVPLGVDTPRELEIARVILKP